MGSDRARQFLPFDALKGFKEAIKERQKIKATLSIPYKQAKSIHLPKRHDTYTKLQQIISQYDRLDKIIEEHNDAYIKNELRRCNSLLSDIDSSVGGKTGCDLPNGKNLVGAFHQPEIVVIDTKALDTLPEKYICDGMGEAVKYGVIRSKELFDKIENGYDTENLIYDCVRIKCDIVENDEVEVTSTDNNDIDSLAKDIFGSYEVE